jgi:hypothetical protein
MAARGPARSLRPAVISVWAGWLVDNAPSVRSVVDQWTEHLVGDRQVRSDHPVPDATWNGFAADPNMEGGGVDLRKFLRQVVLSLLAPQK